MGSILGSMRGSGVRSEGLTGLFREQRCMFGPDCYHRKHLRCEPVLLHILKCGNRNPPALAGGFLHLYAASIASLFKWPFAWSRWPLDWSQ
jgi:hypothetical protein